MSLTGTLSELALCDLVEITTLGAKTGVLDVAHIDGSPAGRLAFRDGARSCQSSCRSGYPAS